MRSILNSLYQRLYSHFGPQDWWPADSPFEVIIGAILTQNTNWLNVERAINNLRENKSLSFSRLSKLPLKKLASLIRPAGYYNIKAKRLKDFLIFLSQSYRANLKKMSKEATYPLREKLLSVKGIGPETADSILLYALNKKTFVVDAYTKRILSRHGLIKQDATYDQVQNLFMRNLKNNVKLFNEYHALLVRLGKEYCLKSKPKCKLCPLG
ncbi:MAG: endonuclease III domain-containing protein [Candidatus Omnitrophica bacterium]|nr:endonuclease III domain-containing protein [Candidatus Omnitrophota bacterium]MBU1091095.1 endonuclease III domain-containing protein [Candidatus Omnitrophota bacterium]